jgi:hypothetical protein
MDANEGVQSFNFEVGQKFKSFKEFESQLKHYQDAKFIQMYRRSSCKIESTKTKQTITNTIDGWKCLKKTKLVKQKKQPNGTVQSVKLMFIFMHP